MSRGLKGPARTFVGDDSKRKRHSGVKNYVKTNSDEKQSGGILGSSWPMSLRFQLLFLLLLMRGRNHTSHFPFSNTRCSSVLRVSVPFITVRTSLLHQSCCIVMQTSRSSTIGNANVMNCKIASKHVSGSVQTSDPPSLGAERLRPALSCGAES